MRTVLAAGKSDAAIPPGLPASGYGRESGVLGWQLIAGWAEDKIIHNFILLVVGPEVLAKAGVRLRGVASPCSWSVLPVSAPGPSPALRACHGFEVFLAARCAYRGDTVTLSRLLRTGMMLVTGLDFPSIVL